ncbi:putative defense protein 1 [Phlebotomus papatasi]|uniref:putative defense protein 1 n=1 Tax=Phlebotomus papatasi TaxID=29031 RepID=UPI0024840D38|nr:putative defense protein 1 [Phlebotomus papatasi]
MLPIFLIISLCSMQVFAKFSCDFDNFHGVPAQPEDTIPYKLSASSYEYGPGTTTTISISGDEDAIRGFYVRAFDEQTNDPIGSWQQGLQGNPMQQCNAIMQADREDKKSVELKWNSPIEGNGKVKFRVMVMKDYSTYWWKNLKA